MNRILSFAKFGFDGFRYQIHFAALLIIVMSSSLTNAQSKDKNNPTQLTSNEISSPIYVDNRNETIYYSFEAGPGDVTIRLNVETAQADDARINELWIGFFTETGKSLVSMHALAMKYPNQVPNQTIREQVEHMTLSRRQKVFMSILFGSGNTPGGKYQVLLSGAIKVGQGALSSQSLPAASGDTYSDGETMLLAGKNSELQKLLPKAGTLRVKMKDGSTKRINLSQVEEIKIEP